MKKEQRNLVEKVTRISGEERRRRRVRVHASSVRVNRKEKKWRFSVDPWRGASGKSGYREIAIGSGL